MELLPNLHTITMFLVSWGLRPHTPGPAASYPRSCLSLKLKLNRRSLRERPFDRPFDCYCIILLLKSRTFDVSNMGLSNIRRVEHLSVEHLFVEHWFVEHLTVEHWFCRTLLPAPKNQYVSMRKSRPKIACRNDA